MREIALDTETTGLDPQHGHRLVEIGCVEMDGRIRTGRYFHFYLNPERDMPEEAFRIHGLSGEFLRDKPLFSHVAEAFLEFIADSPLVIHNAAFDMKFLNAELVRAGHAAIPMERAVDTVVLARRKFPGSPANLDALCRRFNIDLSARTKHGALLDAELLAEVYLELMGGRQRFLSLEAEPEQSAAATEEEAAPEAVSALGLVFPVVVPTEEECAAHRAMMRGVKQPLWERYCEKETND